MDGSSRKSGLKNRAPQLLQTGPTPNLIIVDWGCLDTPLNCRIIYETAIFNYSDSLPVGVLMEVAVASVSATSLL